MRTRQKLAKVGEPVMLTVPPEMLEEMGLEVGQEVLLSSRSSTVRVEPSASKPAPDAVEFAHRFTKKYEEAMRNLAQR